MNIKYLISILSISFLFILSVYSCNIEKNNKEVVYLKDALKNDFYIGVALNTNQIWNRDTSSVRIVKQQFNSIVAENCMKTEEIQPKEGQFNFANADKFVKFGEQNKMFIIGHTLIWHSQCPDWFFEDKNGNEVFREVLIERMKNHITTVVSRYKGRVKAWDVVNEAVLDDGSLRNSKFLKIIGEDYIRLAFEFAHAADPEAELYYNDYSMALPEKCAGVARMIKKLQTQQVKVDGIGMQGHLSMDFPTVDAFEKSIVTFYNLKTKVMITELDITTLPTPSRQLGAEVSLNYEYQKEMNPYANGLPEEKSEALQRRYLDFFRLFLKHKDKISRVTLWGVCDQDSWRNNWPMHGRTDYPLLFDRSYNAKPVVNEIIRLAGNK